MIHHIKKRKLPLNFSRTFKIETNWCRLQVYFFQNKFGTKLFLAILSGILSFQKISNLTCNNYEHNFWHCYTVYKTVHLHCISQFGTKLKNFSLCCLHKSFWMEQNSKLLILETRYGTQIKTDPAFTVRV